MNVKVFRRRLPGLSLRLAFILGLVTLFGCALLNNRTTFDLIWIVGTGLGAALLTFLVLAPKLLPVANSPHECVGAYRLFLTHLLGSKVGLTLVREGKAVNDTPPAPIRPRAGSQAKPLEENDETLAGVIVTDSTSVIVLRTATGISRVVGAGTEQGQSPSGVIFTYPGEEIDTIVDLRPQLRFMTTPIPAQTRDGITIGVRAIAFFTLRGTKSRRMRELMKASMRWTPPFTWRRASVLQAISNRRIVRHGDKDERTEWSEQVLAIAIPQLRQLVAQYTIDELTAPLTSDRHPRFVIRDELVKTVRDQLATNDDFHHDAGLDIRFMAVPVMFPPDPIIRQRIESWKSEWRKKATEVMGEAEAEAIRTREQARAQVQGEMTARINDALQEAKASGTNNSDLITLRFLEAMEKMAKDPTTRALLTLDSLKILKQLREMLASDQSGGIP